MSSIEDDQADFRVDGYILNAITYTMFTIVVLFVGPYINHVAGTRLTMFICSIGSLVGILSLLAELPWAVYAGTVVAGVTSGILWPAECHYMIKNSSPENTGRNVSIFWCIYSLSSFIGNLGVFFAFRDKKYIDHSTRKTALLCLVALNTLAIVQFALLPKPLSNCKPKNYGVCKTLSEVGVLLKSERIVWLLPSFIYAGFQQAFWNGIYSSSVGFTLAFGNSAKELVALSGIAMSIGAVSGATLPIVFSGLISRKWYARRVVVAVAGVAGLCTYLIAYLNLSDEAVFGDTDQQSLIRPPSVWLALLGSFFLCLGDSLINIEVHSFVGDYYRDISTEACAFYKCIKNLFLSASFFGCSHIGLHSQLAVLAVMAVLGVAGFCMGDRRITTADTQLPCVPGLAQADQKKLDIT